MGLDTTAYSRLELVDEHVGPGEWCDNEDHVFAFAYDFPRSYRGLAFPSSTWDDRFIGGRCYTTTSATKTARTHTSYSGHGHFRELLATSVGHDAHAYWDGRVSEDAPFYELINFADNEGVIGSDAARDLVTDFAKHRDGFAAIGADWLSHYDKWRECAVLAADGGLIEFH